MALSVIRTSSRRVVRSSATMTSRAWEGPSMTENNTRLQRLRSAMERTLFSPALLQWLLFLMVLQLALHSAPLAPSLVALSLLGLLVTQRTRHKKASSTPQG